MDWNKIEVVQSMQAYIKENVFKEDFSIDEIYLKIGYSKRHCERIFKELIEKTPLEYVKSILLSNSSRELIKTDNKTYGSMIDIEDFNLEFCKRMAKRLEIMTYKYEQE